MLASIIPTRIHGILDYLVSLVLIASPWLLGFSHDRVAMLVPVVLGAGSIVYSLLTNYEWGAVRVIPMAAHLTIDLLSGALLAASPWLLGFAGRVSLPHLVFGIMEVVIALISSRQVGYGPTVTATAPATMPA